MIAESLRTAGYDNEIQHSSMDVDEDYERAIQLSLMDGVQQTGQKYPTIETQSQRVHRQ